MNTGTGRPVVGLSAKLGWIGGNGVKWTQPVAQLVLPNVTLNLGCDGDSTFVLSSQSDSPSEQ